MTEENKVIKYYDDFIVYQIKAGLNDRIVFLYKALKKTKANSSSKILELGCGIGVMTNLILRKIKPSLLESVDISPKSVKIIKDTNKNSRNLICIVDDIVNYKPSLNSYDIITLFDVIEHLPYEQLPKLFKNISKVMNEDSLLLINIPSPQYQKWLKKFEPEKLQIIDHEIYLEPISKILSENKLEITEFKSYSIWKRNDYNFFRIEKQKEVSKDSILYKSSKLQKVIRRVNRFYLRF